MYYTLLPKWIMPYMSRTLRFLGSIFSKLATASHATISLCEATGSYNIFGTGMYALCLHRHFLRPICSIVEHDAVSHLVIATSYFSKDVSTQVWHMHIIYLTTQFPFVAGGDDRCIYTWAQAKLDFNISLALGMCLKLNVWATLSSF